METNYASDAKGNTAVALGATALGGTVLNWLTGGCGPMGNGMARTAGAMAEAQYCSSLQAEVGQLRAEKYADKNTADVYAALKADTNRLADKIGNIEKWQAAEMAAAPLREALIKQRLEYVERAVGAITVIRVPNGILTPGVPPVEVVHTGNTPAVAA